MPILVIAELSAPEGQFKILKRAVSKLSEETREEPGCLSYRQFVDAERPQVIVILEKWQNEAALAAHRATTHVARFKLQISDVEMVIEKFEI